jgi:hypothetical protein
MMKSYSELRRFSTFEERFEYLRLRGKVGELTFGFERYLNQALYHSREWKYTKRDVVSRDNGCDLGVEGYEIYSQLLIHHINPVTIEDIEDGADCVFDPDNLITTKLDTHNALHFGNIEMLPRAPIVRHKSDTCLWHRK